MHLLPSRCSRIRITEIRPKPSDIFIPKAKWFKRLNSLIQLSIFIHKKCLDSDVWLDYGSVIPSICENDYRWIYAIIHVHQLCNPAADLYRFLCRFFVGRYWMYLEYFARPRHCLQFKFIINGSTSTCHAFNYC